MRLPDAALRPGLVGLLLLSIALLPLAAPPAFGEPVRAAVSLGSGSELWLEGTSTMHDYECRTSKLEMKLLKDAAQADPKDVAALDAWLRAGGLKGLDLLVPVGTMVSGKDGLDKNMYKTMRTKEFPNIRFLMSNAQFGTARGDTLPVTASGTLTITGQQRPVTVQGHIVRAETGVWLEGTHPMKMSDFGIKPPKMMMGTIKVHDPIVVRYRLLLVPGEASGDKAATHK
jgi:hypothetical protein